MNNCDNQKCNKCYCKGCPQGISKEQCIDEKFTKQKRGCNTCEKNSNFVNEKETMRCEIGEC